VNHEEATRLAVLAFQYSVLTRKAEQARGDIKEAQQRIERLEDELDGIELEARSVFQQIQGLQLALCA
jgi:uncharacterized protein (UPF0335 family)